MVMKLQFKHQQFQADAAKAVVDVFEGQPKEITSYMIDPGNGGRQLEIGEVRNSIGWSNNPIILTEESLLNHIRKIQHNNSIEPSSAIVSDVAGKYNLTIEMETGVGKTYTYIKTIFELYKKYGWSKYIVVVPSIAIREGVKKSFDITKEHFKEEYGEEIHTFIYNSANLTDIRTFERERSIQVMIINSQAFNASGKDARRIYMKLDEFQSRRPIDAISQTHPILIIDEPQSVEGEKTKENLKKFNPLFTLRYSATPKEQYNLIYRLDALEAYNKQLVKKISVKGIQQKGDAATEGYVYLEKVNTYTDKNPTATIGFYQRRGNTIKETTVIVKEKENLYDKSGNLESYRNGFVITGIDGRDNSITLGTTLKLYEGDVVGKPSEEILRRIQIRETIMSHLERERQLYKKGIKVLSLFFIDEVANYKTYENGVEGKGRYAEIFEEEYAEAVKEVQHKLEDGFGEDTYIRYLKNNSIAEKAHAGYFSIDKKTKHIVNSKVKSKKEQSSDDVDAYDLIMKNKEQLLSLKEPVRFIFSHSALKEGWDNPNVFQICTLKQSSSEIRKRQEVGRGMRLCVNQNGVRMDESTCDEKVHDINLLTVIASESYESFARSLQEEISQGVADRMPEITPAFFIGKKIKDKDGNQVTIDRDTADSINESLISSGYLKKRVLTEKYYDDKAKGTLEFDEELLPISEGIISIIDSAYKIIKVEDGRSHRNVELRLKEKQYNSKDFQALWNKINQKTAYQVEFNTNELINSSIRLINEKLHVSTPEFEIKTGVMENIKSKEDLEKGTAMRVMENGTDYVSLKDEAKKNRSLLANKTKYDLIGKVVDETGLTRKTVADILVRINERKFDLFRINPEEFILKVSHLINSKKAEAVIEHVTYHVLDEKFEKNVFTDVTIRGKVDENAMRAEKHLYNYVVYDSRVEREFAEKLEEAKAVIVYVKLPRSFFIPTPMGKYNPDWAIVFTNNDLVKHVYFVAETKGSTDTNDLRETELGKIECAQKHFAAISGDKVQYHVVESFDTLKSILDEIRPDNWE